MSAIVEAYPPAAREHFLVLRELVFESAERLGVGPLEETLKWGEPAYLTSRSGSGTTIRIAWKQKTPEVVGIFVHCQTSLIDTFRTIYPELAYEGNRAILVSTDDIIPISSIKHCLEAALTYHSARKSPSRANV